MGMKKTSLCCAALAAAGLLAAAPAMAADELPMTCNTGEGGDSTWTVEVNAGPCAVDCGNPSATTFCSATGACTGIEYKITGNPKPDHVAALVGGGDVVYAGGSGSQVYADCEGDPVTGLGVLSCHEQAVKINPEGSTTLFRVVVQGTKEPIPTSIAVRKGNRLGACEIAGLGRSTDFNPDLACVPSCGNFNPKQQILREEILKFKDCSVRFVFDTATGEVVTAGLTSDSDFSCDFEEFSVADLELRVNGATIVGSGAATFGDGYISTGSDSCTTRVIGGRVYTWGAPCP